MNLMEEIKTTLEFDIVPFIVTKICDAEKLSTIDAVKKFYNSNLYESLEKGDDKLLKSDISTIYSHYLKEINMSGDTNLNNLDPDERGEYLIFMIEEYKFAKKLNGREIISLFDKFGVLFYIYDCYGAMHTLDTDYNIEDIDEFIDLRS